MSAIIKLFLTHFHRNEGNVAGNKNIISADIECVGQGHRLKKIIISWFLFDRLQPNVHQNDAIVAGN